MVVNRGLRRIVLVVALSPLFGLVVWLVTFASQPRYSYTQSASTAPGWWFVCSLVGAALVGGWLAPRVGWLVGLMLGLPPLVLSPWTAPRGDNDGLWLLIVPMLAVFIVVLVGASSLSGWFRERIDGARMSGQGQADSA